METLPVSIYCPFCKKHTSLTPALPVNGNEDMMMYGGLEYAIIVNVLY